MTDKETRASCSFVAGCALFALALMGVTYARSANPPPRQQPPEWYTGGATLCGNNPFCSISGR